MSDTELVNTSPNQTCQVLSFHDGGVPNGRGGVLLVEAAGDDDGDCEEGQLDELPLIWKHHRDGHVGQDLAHQPCVLVPVCVTLLAHLLYALFLLLLLLLPGGSK